MIDDPNAVSAHDVLDHIRPTVVVRRRVWEPPAELRRPVPPPTATREVDPGDEDDDDLEDDDLDIDDDDLEDDVAVAPVPVPLPMPAPAPAAVPPPSALIGRMLEVGDTIPLAELAHAMKRSRAEVAAELVGRGFFEVTGKAVLSHETACIAATAFGWSVLRVRSAVVPPPRPSGVRVAATKSRARKAVPSARKASAPATRKKAGRRAA